MSSAVNERCSKAKDQRLRSHGQHSSVCVSH